MHGVVPAQQRLERDQRARAQREDRLVVQPQLAGAQSAPQPRLQRAGRRSLAHGAGGPGAEHAVALGQRRQLPAHEPVAADHVLGARRRRSARPARSRARPAARRRRPSRCRAAPPPSARPARRRSGWRAARGRRRRARAAAPRRRRASGACRRRRAGVALEVLRELAADGGEHRRHLGVRLADAVREELDHAGAVVGDGDREGGRGHQAGAARGRGARLAGAPTSATQDGRRNAHTRPGRPWPAASTVRLEASASAATSGDGARGVPGGGAVQLAAVGRRPPDGAAAPAQRLAERRRARADSSSPGSSPAATWSVTACWASRNRWAPPTRRRRRVESSARRRARGSSAGSGTTAAAPSSPRTTAARSPRVHVRRDGEEGQVRVGEAHERERLAGRHGARAVAAVQHGPPAAALQRGGQLVGAVRVLDAAGASRPPPSRAAMIRPCAGGTSTSSARSDRYGLTRSPSGSPGRCA